MTVPCFVDTNILVYAAREKHEAPAEFAIANEILQSEPFCLSAQVLQEFYVAVRKPDPRRPLSVPLSDAVAAEWVGWLSPFCEVTIDSFLVQQAIETARKHKVSYWDGAVLAAAARVSAAVLYTEDLNHGQKYDGVQVVNPFRSK